MEMNELTQVINALNILHKDKLDCIIESIKKDSKTEPPTRSLEIQELFAALAKAQAELKAARYTKENRYFKERYADWTETIESSRPSLTKYGLSVLQPLITDRDGQTMLHTILAHASGQWIESRLRVLPPKNDIQTFGSYLTSLKRYAYATLIGISFNDDDDDGEIAMISAREIIAKGPSNKYNPKEQSPEAITKEQLEELEYELADHPDLAEEILDKLRINSLADMPKSKYMISIQRIREIKLARAGAK